MDTHAEFGRRLAELRKARGWSQEKLALESGLARSYLGGVERGQRNISLANMAKLAETLGQEVGDLMGRSQAAQSDPRQYHLEAVGALSRHVAIADECLFAAFKALTRMSTSQARTVYDNLDGLATRVRLVNALAYKVGKAATRVALQLGAHVMVIHSYRDQLAASDVNDSDTKKKITPERKIGDPLLAELVDESARTIRVLQKSLDDLTKLS